MTLFDHLFVFLLLVVAPVAGYLSFKRLRKRVASGEIIGREEIYNSTLVSQWGLLAIALIGWIYLARSWSALGLRLNLDRDFAIGVVLTLIAIGVLIYQIVRARNASEEELLELRQSVDVFDLMMPRNGNELARFYGLSITAGIVEELLWRGFLFWYLEHFMPLWGAALVSTLAFAIGHAYQGLRQLPAIALVGGVFAALYLLTGSVWLPMLLHAAVDILQGRMAYEIMQRTAFTRTDAAAVTP